MLKRRFWHDIHTFELLTYRIGGTPKLAIHQQFFFFHSTNYLIPSVGLRVLSVNLLSCSFVCCLPGAATMPPISHSILVDAPAERKKFSSRPPLGPLGHLFRSVCLLQLPICYCNCLNVAGSGFSQSLVGFFFVFLVYFHVTTL